MFVVSVYDLYSGAIVSTEEFEKLQDALDNYAIATKNSDDCYGVLLYCGWEEAPIICGFGDTLDEVWEEARG